METNEQKIFKTAELVIINEQNNLNKKQIINYENFIKPHWWENIPLIGTVRYSIRTNNIDITAFGIHTLDKNIANNLTKTLFGTLIIGFFVLTLITPWWNYFIIKHAIQKTKKQLQVIY